MDIRALRRFTLSLLMMPFVAYAGLTDALQAKFEKALAAGLSGRLVEDYRSRKERVDFAGEYLAAKYVGQEAAIRALLAKVTNWYLFREDDKGIQKVLQFGPPGTAKSAAVLDLAKILGLVDRFLAVRLGDYIDSGSQGSLLRDISHTNYRAYNADEWRAAVAMVKRTGAIKMKPKLILIEELQLAANLGLFKKEVPSKALESFWDVLANNGTTIIGNSLRDALHYFISDPSYSGNRLRISIEEAKSLYNEMSNQRNVELDFSGSLFIFNGNLDNIFMGLETGGVEDEEVLDRYRRHTEQLTWDQISEELSKLFSRRILSRLGTNYVKYLPPRADHLREFTNEQLKLTSRYPQTEKLLGIEKIVVNWDESVVDAILRKVLLSGGGYRQVISTVPQVTADPIGDVITKMVHDKLTFGKNRIVQLSARAESETHLTFEVVLPMNHLRYKKYQIETNCLKVSVANTLKEIDRDIIALHEAAHATVGFGTTWILPSAIKATSNAGDTGGYVRFREVPGVIGTTREAHLDNLACSLAGYAGENLVQGDATYGAVSDIERATNLARDMVLHWGQGDDFNLVSGELFSNDQRDTTLLESRMQKLLEQGVLRAEGILLRERKFWSALFAVMKTTPSVDEETFVRLLEEHWTDREAVEKSRSGISRYEQNCQRLLLFAEGSPELKPFAYPFRP